MSGSLALLAASGAGDGTPSNSIGLSIAGDGLYHVSGSSGFAAQVEATVTYPAGSQSGYTFITVAIEQGKVDFDSGVAGSGGTPARFQFRFRSLSVGEQSTSVFQVTAQRGGYTDGQQQYAVTVVRDS